MDDFIRSPRKRPLQTVKARFRNADAILTKRQPTPTATAPEPEPTPEAVTKITPAVDAGEPPKTKRQWLPRLRRQQLSRKQWILLSVGLVLLMAMGAYGARLAYRHFSHVPKPEVAKANPKPIKPKTEPSRLTGVQVDPELNKRPVTGIMIENSPDSRPQSGLKDAGVVFEAIAEGGITRFLTLFQEAQPDYIGPVRSARPYYLDWLLPFDASYAHVGGSPDALKQIPKLGVKNLDEFANAGAYWRVTSRFAPHNVYTSMAKMDALNQSKGYTSSNFTGFGRKKETAAKTPTVTSIDFKISGSLYNPHYDYDVTTNSYRRSEGGKPHIDEKSNIQLSPKVVIALVMRKSLDYDGKHTAYTTTGSGPMFIFQDGGVAPGTWQKTDRKNQFVFNSASGTPFKLNPGQTWLSIVSDTGAVTYK